MKSYVLLIELKKKEKIEIGKLGSLILEKGFYAYVGSAKKNLIQRIRRHYSTEKKVYWHVDYLLKFSVIVESYVSSMDECRIARELSTKFSSISGFGSSDCRCSSHLFYSDRIKNFRDHFVSMDLKRYMGSS